MAPLFTMCYTEFITLGYPRYSRRAVECRIAIVVNGAQKSALKIAVDGLL